ncbi:MAG: dockerin type I repeat-containing protein, partial [Clostridia bacterium]|nr:dockerin type I repeat-containing protein [Clostridia bacterium]
PDINETDPVINRTDFQCTRVQCGTYNKTTNVPAVLTEKTRIFTLKMTVKATLPADAVSGLITMDARTFRGVENNTTAYPFYISNPTYNEADGTYSTGDTVDIIGNFDNARLELEIGEDEEVIALTPAQGSTTVVDTEKSFVYGLAEELTFAQFKSDYATVIGTATVECADTVLKTGSVIKLVKDGEVKAEYTVIIYGDIDCDGIADGNDSFLVNMVVSGMLSADALTAAQKLAADPNHDGKIDDADYALLAESGLLKATVSQVPNA